MELQIIKHSDILFRDVLRAIAVKSVAWPHPMESQLKWIIDNMKPEDIHVFLTDEGEDVAYMTLSPVKGILNGRETTFLGIGCVCSAVKGTGYGNRLMQEVNSYLRNNNSQGLLFCREGVTKFYQKNNWQIVASDKVRIEKIHGDVFVMVYNTQPVESLQYSDRLF